MHFPIKKQGGFTVVELLVSITIIAILAFLGAVSFLTFRQNAELSVWANNIVEVSNVARQRTMQSESAANYGIHLESDTFTMFSGLAYDPVTLSNVIYNLPSSLEIADINLALASPDIIFSKITGNVSNYGTFALRQTSDASKSVTIRVEESGGVGIGVSPLEPIFSRIIDSRHIHFIYDQDIQSASTIVLDFPDTVPASYSIDFQTYLSGGDFNWSGSVDVNGSDQVLKINTHGIDPTSATFSIQRDRRYNDKPLQIYLDGQNLINYTADGIETNGSSIWVGDPKRQ